MKPSIFFKSLNLAAFNEQTQQYIREAVLTFPNIDLLEGTKEFAMLQQQVNEHYQLALGKAPVVPKKEEKAPEPKVVKVDAKKKEDEAKAEKTAAIQAQIVEMDELLELLNETLAANPKDTETSEMIELLTETKQGLQAELGTFADGGSVDAGLQAKLDAIFKKYAAKDYWGYEPDMKVKEWQYAVERGDANAKKYTEKDVRDNIAKLERNGFDWMVNKYKELIETKNVAELKSRVRYDQKVSLEIYEVLTGEKIAGKSNKQLAEYFDNEFGTKKFAIGGVIAAAAVTGILGYTVGKNDPFASTPAKSSSTNDEEPKGKFTGEKPYQVSLDTYGHIKDIKKYPKKLRWYEPNGEWHNRTYEKWDGKKWVEIDSVELAYYEVSVEKTNPKYTYRRDTKAKKTKDQQLMHHYNLVKRSKDDIMEEGGDIEPTEDNSSTGDATGKKYFVKKKANNFYIMTIVNGKEEYTVPKAAYRHEKAAQDDADIFSEEYAKNNYEEGGDISDSPFNLGDWSADMPSTKRRTAAVRSRDSKLKRKDKYASAARALAALAKTTSDKKIKQSASRDAEYFSGK